MIILSLVICAAVMGTVTLLWWLFAKGYTADAYLHVAPPPVSMMQLSPQHNKDVVERNKQSQAALVKHQIVLLGVAEDYRMKDPKTAAGKWFKKYKNKIEEELEDEIDISLMPNTNFIKLSMTGTDRKALADIVNAMADSFVGYTRKITRRGRASTEKKFQDERTTLIARRTAIRRELASTTGRENVAAMLGRQNTVAAELMYLTREIGEAENERSMAETGMATFKEGLDAYKKGDEEKSIANDPEILMRIDMDYTLRGLENQLAGLETVLHNAVQKFGEKHRQVKDIKGMILAVKNQIESRTKEVLATQISMMGQMRWIQWEGTKNRLADLEDRRNKARASAKDLQKLLGDIELFQQELDNIQIKLTGIETKLSDLRMLGSRPGEERFETGPVTIEAYATLPREDDWTQPNVAVLMPIGVVLGLMVGFGLAFLLEFMDTSVKSPSDLARRVDLPLLGMVPHGDDLDEDISDFRRVSLLAPHSPASEAFRQIRTNLLFSGPEQQRRSLLVTSPAPQDGRTTVVVNLATSMAQSGRKVLLVDANFHRPAVAEMFSKASDAGLSSALVGQTAWRDVVSTTEIPNLSVMTSGPLPPNPADLLGSDAMSKIISEMTDEYDQVLFDGSPLMVVADSCVLGTKVDGVILVVRAGVNSVGIVQRSSERLSRLGARVFGVVLQGVRSTAGGYLRKNYETFYEYHQKSLT